MSPYANLIGLLMLDVDFSISAVLKAPFAALRVYKYSISHEKTLIQMHCIYFVSK